jgi:hypothetical protein
MAEWTEQDILEAAAAWVWVPAGAEQVRTDEYQLIRYPDRLIDPTWPPAHVAWSKTTRAVDDVIDEVAGHVRAWDLGRVHWWVSNVSAPSDTEQVLRARGGVLDETLEVLAYDLSFTGPAPDAPEDVTVELVHDERTVRAAAFVAATGWGRPDPDEAEVARQLADLTGGVREGPGFRIVAFVGNQPVSTGGCTLAGPVARLWGAVTLPAWRGRGGYRSVLAERMRLAAQRGATLALVKGRVDTSGPILKRVGFLRHGEERRYRLDLG